MTALFKTLFGDAANIAVVAIVMSVEVLLVANDKAALATFTVAPLVLAGAAWLAKR
jgi:hypothetical protein